MIISKCLKYIMYYFVLKVIYRFIKNYSYKNVNIETLYDTEESDTLNINECTTLVLYQGPFQHGIRQKYNLKNIYNNFFNGIRENIKNDINPAHLKTEFKKRDVPIILLKDSNKSFTANELKWSFTTKEDYHYKIKVYLKLTNKDCNKDCNKDYVKNIEMSISDSNGNAFIYDYILYNIENEMISNDCDYINDFSFILDNNAFDNNEITIKLNLGNNDNNIQYLIDLSMIDVIEKKLVDETPILIFDVNERYTPLYFNEKNILDLQEFESDDFE